MILKTIPVGGYQANCYLFGDSDTREIVIIDPGDDPQNIFHAVEAEGAVVKAVTFTHAHLDHVGALEEVSGHYNAPVIKDVHSFSVGKHLVSVIPTPGHSPESVCFHTENILFSGDTLFFRSVGRCDLPGGSFAELEKSIQHLYAVLDDETRVYPGHGPMTTIGAEKALNPYVRD